MLLGVLKGSSVAGASCPLWKEGAEHIGSLKIGDFIAIVSVSVLNSFM